MDTKQELTQDKKQIQYLLILLRNLSAEMLGISSEEMHQILLGNDVDINSDNIGKPIISRINTSPMDIMVKAATKKGKNELLNQVVNAANSWIGEHRKDAFLRIYRINKDIV